MGAGNGNGSNGNGNGNGHGKKSHVTQLPKVVTGKPSSASETPKLTIEAPPPSQRVTRRDARIEVAWEVTCEKTRGLEQQLHPALARVYERVHADESDIGKRFVGTLRDLSVNGAFIEAEALPLLSRVNLTIAMPSFKPIDAVGWVLWRRSDACTVTRASGAPLTLGAGFGVIFEWISLEARIEIARRVALLK